MKKVINIVCMVLLCSLLFGCGRNVEESVFNSERENKLFLVAGFDDAAENTDVLFTFAYEKATNSVYVAQIPRDTYYDFGSGQNKINHLYASKIYAGKTPDEAMSFVAGEIENLTGADFDGYMGINTSTFKDIVDAVGGVDIELSYPVTISIDGENTLSLKAGVNHIDGSAAMSFVRYRKGYNSGDLGRLDAQKIFLCSLFNKISSGLNLPALLTLSSKFQNDIVTDMKLSQLAFLFIEAMRSSIEPKTFFCTLPGEPAFSNSGISYYVLNKKSAKHMAERYMFSAGEFDKAGKCVNEGEISFSNIYHDDNFKYAEYSNDEIKDIVIKNNYK